VQELFKIKCADLAKIKKLPPRDQGHYLPFNTYPHGCPLGGFGAGTIGRSPYGDFNIWHIKVGAHIAEELKACCFHVYQKDSQKTYVQTLTTRPYKDTALKHLARPYAARHGQYAAAYPKAKYVFDDPRQPAEITCEQYSPVLPHNYKETSYPVAVFEHTVRNKTAGKIEVALCLSWANMTGWSFEDQRPGVQDNWFGFVKNNADKRHTLHTRNNKNQKLTAIIMGGSTPLTARKEMDGEIGIAVLGDARLQTSAQQYFYLQGTGEELYKSFAKNGTLDNRPPQQLLEHQNYGAAAAGKVILQPGETRKITFLLVWDLPVVHFGAGTNKYKYYTRFFDRSGRNALALLKLAARDHQKWSGAIDKWQQEISSGSKTAPLLRTEQSRQNYLQMLINELYFLADGGSFWDARTGSFGLLECFDYPFYETLDVRFYSSFPLLKFWPEIELKIMRNFAATIAVADKQITRYHLHADKPALPLPKNPQARLLCADQKKKRGACPHDLGSPKQNPFAVPSAYTWQNTNYWKDLNSKFILLVYRDFVYTGDKKFLKDLWPAMRLAADYLHKMDRDNDGIPENSGYPDQTYDNWSMRGVSAYCGSLWLAALRALADTARALDDSAAAMQYSALLAKAQKTFDQKLWNGRYYNFCAGNTDIMADQLIGQWYIDLLKTEPILSNIKITSALRTIYKYNYKRTQGGRWGILSGKTARNKMTAAEQGRDVWVGANFALCSLFLHHGLPRAAEQVLNTLSKIIYSKGFFFRTPEGWDTAGQFTATMYMRPNAIWSLEF
jgi:non-lysosomal glucosylceramidase